MKQNHSHDILAKLLATENLSVIRAPVPTASFDILNRILRLPQWKDLTPEVEEMLILHEVGHALYTTIDGYGEIYKSKPYLSGYANIIEDVRIEKKMKQRYPGSRKSFNAGYNFLNDKDFFGVNDRDLTKLLLIDRINIFYKVGYASGVSFTPEEYEFVAKTDRCVTEEDVIRLAEEIFEYSKASKEEEKQEEITNGYKVVCDGDGEIIDDENLQPETIDAFEEKLNEHTDAQARTYYFDAKFKYECDDVIVPHTRVAEELFAVKDEFAVARMKRNATEFKTATNNVVSYLVKEFEMRKSASAYKRAKISKLGQLDSRKLFAYKLKDDIFKQIATVQEGKKHGMLFLLDWSGSMSNCIDETLHQVVSLAMFCQKINIPYQVFAFTDGYIDSRNLKSVNDTGIEDSRGLHLLEFFSHKMNTRQFNRMIELLLDKPHRRSDKYGLNGTPLNTALLYSLDYIGKFIRDNQVEKMTLITLTDGESNELYSESGTIKNGRAYIYEDNRPTTVNATTMIRDTVTKREYVLTDISSEQTSTLMNIIRDRYSIHSVGFYITPSTYNGIQRFARSTLGKHIDNSMIASIATKIHQDMCKDKCAVTKNIPGRDELYLIAENAKIEEGHLTDVNGDMSAAQISRQLTKAVTTGKTSRVILNSFVGMVA